MRIVAAYLLATLGGDNKPETVRGILEVAGVDCHEDMLDLFYKSVEGKDLNELLQLGTQKFASGGGGAGGAVVSSGGGGAASAAAAAPAAEEPKEEKKEEKEESDDDMGFSLFD